MICGTLARPFFFITLCSNFTLCSLQQERIVIRSPIVPYHRGSALLGRVIVKLLPKYVMLLNTVSYPIDSSSALLPPI
jgi:hypothetical protein